MNGNSVRIAAICRMCNSRLSSRPTASIGHLIRHQKSCRKKTDHAARVQSRLALNPDGLHNWVHDPIITRSEFVSIDCYA